MTATETLAGPARKLTSTGAVLFRNWLEAGAPADRAPTHLLWHETHSAEIPGAGAMENDFPRTRFEMARNVVRALGADVVKRSHGAESAGVWMWQTIYHHKVLFRKWPKGEVDPAKPGKHFLGKLSRHLPVLDDGGFYEDGGEMFNHRHLVSAAAEMVARHGDEARFLLSNEPASPSRAEEHIYAVQIKSPMMQSPGFLQCVNLMYGTNDAAGRPALAKGANTSEPGGIEGLLRTMRMLHRKRYDLMRMDADKILSLIPEREFGEHLARARARASLAA